MVPSWRKTPAPPDRRNSQGYRPGSLPSVERLGRRARLAGLKRLPGLCSQTLPGSRARVRPWRRRSSGSCGRLHHALCRAHPALRGRLSPPCAPPALLPSLLPPCRLGAPAPSRYKACRPSDSSSASERPSDGSCSLARARRHGRAPVQCSSGLASGPPVDLAQVRVCGREPAHMAAHIHQGTAALGPGRAGQHGCHPPWPAPGCQRRPRLCTASRSPSGAAARRPRRPDLLRATGGAHR